MDYRGYNIRKHRTGAPYGPHYSAHKPGPTVTATGYLVMPIATDVHPVGIMRAVDDYIATGRPQYRVS